MSMITTAQQINDDIRHYTQELTDLETKKTMYIEQITRLLNDVLHHHTEQVEQWYNETHHRIQTRIDSAKELSKEVTKSCKAVEAAEKTIMDGK